MSIKSQQTNSEMTLSGEITAAATTALHTLGPLRKTKVTEYFFDEIDEYLYGMGNFWKQYVSFKFV